MHRIQALVFDQLRVGLCPSCKVSLSKTFNHDCFVKVGEVVLSALPARVLIDSTQAYIKVSPVSAPGVHVSDSGPVEK